MKQNRTILIVEDESPLRRALRDKLTREGFDVSEAKNGVTGLAAAITDHPDLILLDIVMPKMDGITLLRQLRNTNDYGKTVPVIFLTNLTSADEQRNQDMAELEPSLYLVKSDWKIQDVVAKIRERLGE